MLIVTPARRAYMRAPRSGRPGPYWRTDVIRSETYSGAFGRSSAVGRARPGLNLLGAVAGVATPVLGGEGSPACRGVAGDADEVGEHRCRNLAGEGEQRGAARGPRFDAVADQLAADGFGYQRPAGKASGKQPAAVPNPVGRATVPVCLVDDEFGDPGGSWIGSVSKVTMTRPLPWSMT